LHQQGHYFRGGDEEIILAIHLAKLPEYLLKNIPTSKQIDKKKVDKKQKVSHTSFWVQCGLSASFGSGYGYAHGYGYAQIP
jgi:hypothetical protein